MRSYTPQAWGKDVDILEVIALPQNLYLPSQAVMEEILHHNIGTNKAGEGTRSQRRGARKFLGRGAQEDCGRQPEAHRASSADRPVSRKKMKAQEHVCVVDGCSQEFLGESFEIDADRYLED